MLDSEFRLRRLEDRAELEDLVVRYFMAADGDDTAGLEASFSENARFSVSGNLGGETCKGIVDFLVEQRASMGLTVHTPNYTLFTIDGDRAEGLIGAHLEMVLGGQSVFGAVRYHDNYLRTGQGWRIEARDMRVIYIGEWKEAGNVLASDKPVQWPGAEPGPSDFPRKT